MRRRSRLYARKLSPVMAETVESAHIHMGVLPGKVKIASKAPQKGSSIEEDEHLPTFHAAFQYCTTEILN